MLTDSVVFSSTTYPISEIVGDAQARPTWISVSGEDFGGYSPTPEIWVGTNGHGVVVIQPGTGNIRRYTTADGLPSNTIRDVEAEHCPKFCDFRDVWIATNGGVGHWDGTSWTAYTVANGLPSDDVRGVAFVQRNVVWAATAHGAAYFDGRTWQAFTSADGLPVEDLQGVIWRNFNVWFNTLGQGLVTFKVQPPSTPQPTLLAPSASSEASDPTSIPTLAPEPTATLVGFAPVKTAEVIEAPDRNEAHNVERISHVETMGYALDVAVVDDFAYVADSEVGFQVVDVSAMNRLNGQPTNTSGSTTGKLPGLAMTSRFGLVNSTQYRPYLGVGPRAYRVVVSGNLAYVGGWDTGQIVDISNPLNPQTINSQFSAAADIAIMGTYAYIIDTQNGSLHMVNVSNPVAPVHLGDYSAKGAHLQGVTVAGNYLFLVGYESDPSLLILDITDPSRPVEVSAFKTPLFAWDVDVSGQYAFVIWNLRYAAGGPIRECNSGVSIVDVSEPKHPVEIGQYCDPGREVADVAVVQNYMYVAAGHRGLQVLDISDPASPGRSGLL